MCQLKSLKTIQKQNMKQEKKDEAISYFEKYILDMKQDCPECNCDVVNGVCQGGCKDRLL